MTGIHRIFDAAYPPSSAPPGCDGVLGYIGGADAAHIWTPQEWQRFAHLIQFPCWVPNISASPGSQAAAALSAAIRLGWAAHNPAGWERVIIYDLEGLSNAKWWQQCAAGTAAGGFTAVAYGSLSSVLQNAAADVWGADWDDEVKLQAGQTIHGTQYESDIPFDGTLIDYSVIDNWLTVRGGVGPRHIS